jgi:alpha-L-fucosidase
MKVVTSLVVCIILINGSYAQYKPTWESLDSRPLPQWYSDSKIGIFIHWGVFSVPSFGNEWFWKNWHDKQKAYVDFMNKNYPPDFTYADFAPKFTAEFYDPNKWADIFKASGAKYVVLTSKHHEGFTLWPSKYSFNWNAMDVGPKRDLLGDLAKAIRNRTDLHFGLYHSLLEWYNPLFEEDGKNGFKTHNFVDAKTMPELYEIVNTYHPEVVWSDGDWSAGDDNYWKSKEFLAWLFSESPVKNTVVTNDRWGGPSGCKHGSFLSCSDRYNPKTIQKHYWENCFTLDKASWGLRREAQVSDYLTIHEIITTIAESVSCNGNVLINVGPTHDGRIIPIQEERLRQLGDWLKVNGEAIYGSTHWTHPNDTLTPGVWFTSKPKESGSPYYAIVLNWPQNGNLELGSISLTEGDIVHMLGVDTPLKWSKGAKGTVIEFPNLAPNKLPSIYAWVLKFAKN